MWTSQQRRRAKWLGAVAGVALNLYPRALAAFQMGGSCNQFGVYRAGPELPASQLLIDSRRLHSVSLDDAVRLQ